MTEIKVSKGQPVEIDGKPYKVTSISTLGARIKIAFVEIPEQEDRNK